MFPFFARLAPVVPVIAALTLLFCAGCALERKKAVDAKKTALVKIHSWSLPDFTDDLSYEGLEYSIVKSLEFFEKKSKSAGFQFGPDRVDAPRMIKSLRLFLDFIREKPSPKKLKKFIRSNYTVYGSAGNKKENGVLFTGYYEPVFPGSLSKSDVYKFPVYGRPADLMKIDLSLFSPEYKGKSIIARHDGQSVVPYFDRKIITADNVLDGKATPIAWLKDPVDIFFLQIQGSGKAIFENGETLSLRYDSQNGRPYRSIGRLLIDTNRIPKSEMSMQRIRAYLEKNPDEVRDVLNHNPSYVFFRKGETRYPTGCINVELTPGRSIATDRRLFPEGALTFVTTSKPLINGNGEIEGWAPMSRFALNQDTGGAIRGPGRADIFFGDGKEAEIAAGHMQHGGRLFFLVAKK